MVSSGFCWSELPPEDILARLKSLTNQTGQGASSGFLDTHQWSALQDEPGISLTGGHPAAQHRRAAFSLPETGVRYFQVSNGDLPDQGRTVRQLRSWLYRQGLPESSLGDIIRGDELTMMVVEPDIELLEAGLPARLMKSWKPPVITAKRTTAAGPRIDAVLTSTFKVSRGEAQTALKFGFIYHNFRQVTKRTATVQAGDQIVYRTKGRAEVAAIESNPRSGRVWVESRYYPV